MKPQFWNHQQYFDNLLNPVSRAVISMERTGIPVDMEALRDIEYRMAKRCGELLKDLNDWAGRDINWSSWQQLAAFLHNEPTADPPGLGLKPSPYCKKGEVPDDKVATDDRALEWLAGHSEVHRDSIQKLRMLRQCTRMGRYARDWLCKALPFGDSTFRLHPSFGLASDFDNRAGAVTGRFGVKNPPLNQVPRNKKKDPAGMRRAFIAPPWHRLVVVDYSQLEVVILSHLIARLFGDNDPLVQMVRSGLDIHGPAARFIFGELAGNERVAKAAVEDFKTVPELCELRDLGKIGIYGKNYCKGVNGFAWSTFLANGEPLGMQRAELLHSGLDQFYPGVPKFQEFIREHITKYGQIVSLFGRWQPLPLAFSAKTGNRNRAWRQACNYPMQASGQEIMAMAIINIFNDEYLKSLGYQLALCVHDELVGWAPDDKATECLARVKELMVNAVELLAPLKGEGHTGRTWADAK